MIWRKEVNVLRLMTCEISCDSVTCKSLCKAVVPADDARFINQVSPSDQVIAATDASYWLTHARLHLAFNLQLIKDDYGNNWMIDGLPAAEMKRDLQTGEVFYDIGGFAL
jgi:transmembrane 9 superfamily protein 2/4